MEGSVGREGDLLFWIEEVKLIFKYLASVELGIYFAVVEYFIILEFIDLVFRMYPWHHKVHDEPIVS